jgi:GNAT superfamily N-acetyltransferase
MCTIIEMPDETDITSVAECRAAGWSPIDTNDPASTLEDDLCLCLVDVPAMLTAAGWTHTETPWGYEAHPPATAPLDVTDVAVEQAYDDETHLYLRAGEARVGRIAYCPPPADTQDDIDRVLVVWSIDVDQAHRGRRYGIRLLDVMVARHPDAVTIRLDQGTETAHQLVGRWLGITPHFESTRAYPIPGRPSQTTMFSDPGMATP